MKTLLAAAVMVLAGSMTGGEKTKVDVHLNDGSRVIGTLRAERIMMQHKGMGRLSFPVRSVAAGECNKAGKLILTVTPKDKVTGELLDKVFEIDTIIGLIRVKARQIKSFEIQTPERISMMSPSATK